jgi:hypothetical protein
MTAGPLATHRKRQSRIVTPVDAGLEPVTSALQRREFSGDLQGVP